VPRVSLLPPIAAWNQWYHTETFLMTQKAVSAATGCRRGSARCQIPGCDGDHALVSHPRYCPARQTPVGVVLPTHEAAAQACTTVST